MKKKIILILLCLFIGVAGIIVPKILNEYKKSVTEKTTVYIPLNSTYTQMLDSLQSAISDMESFEKVAKKASLQEKFKPGRYILTPDKSNKDIVRMLQNGWESPMMLTLSGNIRNLEKLSGILGKRLAADSAAFMVCFLADSLWMGKILPNTYEVYWTVTPGKFIERMEKEYEKFWNEERTAKAAKIGLSKEEVSILASIVCEETNFGPEMPKVAGVYMNRLNRGMKLDADPTVKFALGDPTIKRILYKHLEVDSPYNTYKNLGLPPGPITIPSIKGIDAVLNYEEHNYLYFCANSNMDGTHKFARTLTEHNKNAKEYQAALNRLKIR